MSLIADEHVVFQSPDPERIYCYSPSILKLRSGRLVVSFDLGGPGVGELAGETAPNGDFGLSNQTRILISDDGGATWHECARLPVRHARLFEAGESLYLLGHSGAMRIFRSRDQGEHWPERAVLESTHSWHQAPCAVDYRHGRVYLTMEQVQPGATWPGVAPVLMAAEEHEDLLQPAAWRFSEPLDFRREVPLPVSCGVPFFPTGLTAPGRFCGDPGWLESHVLRLYDPDHLFFDPDDRAMLILMRAHTGLANLGAVALGTDLPDGTLTLRLLRTPGGAPLVYLPLPGGQMKFHIVYDPVSQCYWLASSRTTDSMTRPDRLPPDRYGLPDNERNQLQLHVSRNLFDWHYVGLAACGATPRESRHYAAMTIDGEDLLLLARSGSPRARSAHNGDLITLHRVRAFRDLEKMDFS